MSKDNNNKTVGSNAPPIKDKNTPKAEPTVESPVKEEATKRLDKAVDMTVDYPKDYKQRMYYKQGVVLKNVHPVTANMLLERGIAKIKK